MSNFQKQAVDHVVVGLSVPGVAAALELASAGRSVCMIEQPDDGSIAISLEVWPSPLNPTIMDARNWQDLAISTLSSAGVPILRIDLVEPADFDETASEIIFTGMPVGKPYSLPIALRCGSAIFAPYGSPSRVPQQLQADRLVGKGICYDASSDRFFYRGMSAAILGCGYFALEQAYLVAEVAEFVTLLCPEESFPEDSALAKKVSQLSNVLLQPGIYVKSVMPRDERTLHGICVQDKDGYERILDASVLFWAGDLRVDWSMWGGVEQASVLVKNQKLYLAGLAGGLPYSNQADFFADGMRAAWQCVSASVVRH